MDNFGVVLRSCAEALDACGMRKSVRRYSWRHCDRNECAMVETDRKIDKQMEWYESEVDI